MTEIGKGSESREADLNVYHKDIERGISKFDQALTGYQLADPEEKKRLQSFMDEQLQVINAAVQEIKRGGMYKQDVKLENDYKEFINTGSQESYSALRHDLQTLNDYNELK